MLTLHFHPSPNPMKAALMLEELGLDHELVPVDTSKGEQHDRYLLEVRRHYGVMDTRLADAACLGGEICSVADVAAWGRVRFAGMIVEGGVAEWPHLSRWFESVSGRPAVAKALSLKERFSLKQDVDEETKRALFPSNYDFGKLSPAHPL